MNSHAEIEESEGEWIGEIPATWDSKRLTFVTSSIGSGATPKSDNDQYYRDGTIPWLVTGDLNDGIVSIVSNKINILAIEDYPALKVWPARSLAIAMYGATIGKVGLLQFPTTVNQANCVFVFNSENCPKFWLYVFLANRSRIVSMRYGGGQPNISQELLKSLRFACPQIEEQSLISTYLDKKTSQIDSLIEKIEQKTELLKEQRTTLISQCVTKGFDPNVKMKDSGVEWIGEIPSHWEVKRLATSVRKCINGVWGIEPDGVQDIVCVRVADFDRTKFRVSLKGSTIRSVPMTKRVGRVLEHDDLLLEKSGGGELQPVGVVILFNREINAVCSNFIARMPVNSWCNSNFLTYLHAYLYTIRLNTRSIKQTTGIQNLDAYSYLNEHVAFPPLSEQDCLSQYLDKKTSQIDSLSEKLQRKIELLKEYRHSLISNVVTGKVKVTEDAS